MTLHPHDHVLRFRFESATRPDIGHVVDLGAFDGFGECSCEDFVYRLRPVLFRNRCRYTESSNVTDEGTLRRCKHLMAAREFLTNQVIARINEGEREI